MTNDSTTAGYLIPVGSMPADDFDLDKILRSTVVGISGLDDGLVVVKGQPVPPARPDRQFTWCAVGVITTDSDANPSIQQRGESSVVSRGETLTAMASFYGPQCRGYATLLRDGLGLGQNRATLRAAGIAFRTCDPLRVVPDEFNTEFVRRADLQFTLARTVSRTYQVRSLKGFSGALGVEGQSTAGDRIIVNSLDTGT